MLRFCHLIEQSEIQHIGMTREDAVNTCALKSMGAACIKGCVRGLSVVYTIVGAYAKKIRCSNYYTLEEIVKFNSTETPS